MTFIKQAMPQQLTNRGTQFSEYHGAVFGSMGAFHYEADGPTLKVFDGGVLLGGTFYLLDGKETFTITAETTYLCVELDKAEVGEPRFFLSQEWKTDSATHHIATVFLIKSERGMITSVDKIGGNLPEVYNLLEQGLTNLTTDVNQQKQNMEAHIYRAVEYMGRRYSSFIETKVKEVYQRMDKTEKELNEKIRNIALYKHVIGLQITIDDRILDGLININLELYNTTAGRCIDPINVNSPQTLTKQIKKALYDGQARGYARTAASGTMLLKDRGIVSRAIIWGISFDSGIDDVMHLRYVKPGTTENWYYEIGPGTTSAKIKSVVWVNEQIIRIL